LASNGSSNRGQEPGPMDIEALHEIVTASLFMIS